MSYWDDKTGLINGLEEEKRKLRKLLEEYINKNEMHIKSIINLNKEKNDLKEELEKLKQNGHNFCYLDELVRINTESLREKMELKEQNKQLKDKIEYMSVEITRLKKVESMKYDYIKNLEIKQEIGQFITEKIKFEKEKYKIEAVEKEFLDFKRFLSDLADERKRNAELEHSNTILKNRLEDVKKAVRL
jgi:hypothetical protein